MPKELIPAGWVLKPCLFLLSPKCGGAEVCGECEGEFSWLGKTSKRHCMFCGYFFHRDRCTRKVEVEGEFFKQRICSRCHYYRCTAENKLKAGEEFECIGPHGHAGGGSKVVISLCEDTAELLLHWKDKEVKETADLATVEVRKGFSHMHQNLDVTSGLYEPLRSFSLFLKDGVGEQCVYHLRACSALTCQLWVEGLKAACYVYHRMIEQEHALDFYSEKAVQVTGRGIWQRRLYLPSRELSQCCPASPLSPAAGPAESCPQQEDEEWEDIASLPYTPTGLFPSPTSLYGNSSGYQSDLSLSFCSSIMAQQHQQRTVHSLPFTSSLRPPTTSRPSSAVKQWSAVHSLPPTTTHTSQGGTPASKASSSTCPCHYRVVPAQAHSQSSSPSALDKCCEACKHSCKLAMDTFNF